MICEEAYQYQQLHAQNDHMMTMMMMDLSQSPLSSPILSNNTDNNEEERLEDVNLSCMALQSLPNHSLNLGIICKLDLSNNHIKVNIVHTYILTIILVSNVFFVCE